MFGYKEFVPLTSEEILKRVSQEDIFEIVFKETIIVGKDKATYVAPYRDDKNPDCYFEYYEGKLFFYDFGSVGHRTHDCFGIITKTMSITYFESLEYINNFFNLGLGSSLNNVIEVKYVDYNPQEKNYDKVTKEKKDIFYLRKNFDLKDKVFWLKYEITSQNLKEDKVVPIYIYKFTNKKGNTIVLTPFDITYAYTDFEDQKVKIYRPNSGKKGKWLTNCNQDDIGSIRHLPKKGDLLIISKSYKDCRVLRNQGLYSIWFQNEGAIPNRTILEKLAKNFKRIVVWFDNDQTGISSGKFVVDYINKIVKNKAKLIFLPPILLKDKVKDPSDLISVKGKKKLIEFLKEKELLT